MDDQFFSISGGKPTQVYSPHGRSDGVLQKARKPDFRQRNNHFLQLTWKWPPTIMETMKRTARALFIIALLIIAFFLIGAVIAFILLFPMIEMAHMENGS